MPPDCSQQQQQAVAMVVALCRMLGRRHDRRTGFFLAAGAAILTVVALAALSLRPRVSLLPAHALQALQVQDHAPSVSSLQDHAPRVIPVLDHASSVSPLQDHAPRVIPALDHAPSVSPLQDHAPRVIPAPDHAPSVSPLQDHAPRVIPALDHAPSVSPLQDHAPRVLPAPDHAPRVIPALDHAPRVLPAPDHAPNQLPFLQQMPPPAVQPLPTTTAEADDERQQLSIARLLRAAARQAGVCPDVVRTGTLESVISAIAAASVGSTSFTSGSLLQEWYEVRSRHLQRTLALRDRLRRLSQLNRQLSARLRQSHAPRHAPRHAPLVRVSREEFAARVRQSSDRSSYRCNNPDIDVCHKTSFDGLFRYAPRQGIGGTPLTTLAWDHKRAVREVVNTVNTSSVDGLFKTHRLAGTVLELFERVPSPTTTTGEAGGANYRLLHHYFLKPFAGLHFVSHQLLSLQTRPVHVVLPLLDSFEAFQPFLRRFLQHALPQQFPWLLTVVYSGLELQGREMAYVLRSLSDRAGFTAHRFVTVDQPLFGAAVAMATRDRWAGGDVITMVTDVHHFFNYRFMRRCQMQARRGSQGYFPISFGLYNPALAPPPLVGSYIHSHYGRWVDVDVGALCLYRSDLELLSAEHRGQPWRSPYEVFQAAILSPRLHVVRPPDPALVRAWRLLVCPRGRGRESHARCEAVRTHTLAPVRRLGEVLR